MKKNASFINLDSSSLRWLLQTVKQAPEEFEGLDDFHDELYALFMDDINSLILSSADHSTITIPDQTMKFRELEIHPRNRTVVEGGNLVNLTPKEFDILLFLAKHQGCVFTKEQIYQAVWEEDYFLSDSNIMAFIRKLRKKIEPNPDEPLYIITIWGVGYKFNDTF